MNVGASMAVSPLPETTPTPGSVAPTGSVRRPRIGARTVLLFLAGLAVAGSAYRATRMEVGGMLVHPYLPFVVLLFVFVAIPRLGRFPRSVLLSCIAFAALYLISLLPGGDLLGELSKVLANLLTIVAVALSIRNERDLSAAVLGLAVAVTVISLVSLLRGGGTTAGVNPLEEVANKNAYSLYALPALLLNGFYLLDSRRNRWYRLALAFSATAIVAAVFSSGNRSGWLGVVLIGVLLVTSGRRTTTAVVVGFLVLGNYFLITQYLKPEVIERRITETQQGNVSDSTRKDLFFTAFDIATENPMLGMSPQKLPYELARRLRVPGEAIDPHNTFGHIMGGSGFITLAALVMVGFCMWYRPSRGRKALWVDQIEARRAHHLVRLMLVLWVVRAMFTREILYNPGFGMGLGIAIGAALMNGAWQKPRPRRAA
jgi:O-antigen ligase